MLTPARVDKSQLAAVAKPKQIRFDDPTQYVSEGQGKYLLLIQVIKLMVRYEARSLIETMQTGFSS